MVRFADADQRDSLAALAGDRPEAGRRRGIAFPLEAERDYFAGEAIGAALAARLPLARVAPDGITPLSRQLLIAGGLLDDADGLVAGLLAAGGRGPTSLAAEVGAVARLSEPMARRLLTAVVHPGEATTISPGGGWWDQCIAELAPRYGPALIHILTEKPLHASPDDLALIGRWWPEEAAQALVKVGADEPKLRGPDAAFALARIGAERPDLALAGLAALARVDDPAVAVQVAVAIGGIGAPEPLTLSALFSAAPVAPPDLARPAPADCLSPSAARPIEPIVSELAQLLVGFLSHQAYHLSVAVAFALARLGRRCPEAIARDVLGALLARLEEERTKGTYNHYFDRVAPPLLAALVALASGDRNPTAGLVDLLNSDPDIRNGWRRALAPGWSALSSPDGRYERADVEPIWRRLAAEHPTALRRWLFAMLHEQARWDLRTASLLRDEAPRTEPRQSDWQLRPLPARIDLPYVGESVAPDELLAHATSPDPSYQEAVYKAANRLAEEYPQAALPILVGYAGTSRERWDPARPLDTALTGLAHTHPEVALEFLQTGALVPAGDGRRRLDDRPSFDLCWIAIGTAEIAGKRLPAAATAVLAKFERDPEEAIRERALRAQAGLFGHDPTVRLRGGLAPFQRFRRLGVPVLARLGYGVLPLQAVLLPIVFGVRRVLFWAPELAGLPAPVRHGVRAAVRLPEGTAATALGLGVVAAVLALFALVVPANLLALVLGSPLLVVMLARLWARRLIKRLRRRRPGREAPCG